MIIGISQLPGIYIILRTRWNSPLEPMRIVMQYLLIKQKHLHTHGEKKEQNICRFHTYIQTHFAYFVLMDVPCVTTMHTYLFILDDGIRTEIVYTAWNASNFLSSSPPPQQFIWKKYVRGNITFIVLNLLDKKNCSVQEITSPSSWLFNANYIFHVSPDGSAYFSAKYREGEQKYMHIAGKEIIYNESYC